MRPGVVHQHIEAPVCRENGRERFFPITLLRDVQLDTSAPFRKLRLQFIGFATLPMNPQPNKILWRFVEKGSGDGAAQTAIGSGNQNDPETHMTLKQAAMACSFGPTTLTVAL